MSTEFLPFCPTDTGTNLISQGAYSVSSARDTGNQPGVASSKLNNKAVRQSSAGVAALMSAVSAITGTDTLDNGVEAQLLAQVKAAFTFLPPVFTKYLTGAGTHFCTFYFFTASANATSGATYTNNGATFTVVTTISGATLLRSTGTGAPAASGTLTKTAGTGDATIAFYAMRASVRLDFEGVGGGGGGGGGGSPGAVGGDTTFGSSLISFGGGGGGHSNGTPADAGGTGTLGSGPVGEVFDGTHGSCGPQGTTTSVHSGVPGACSPYAGGGAGGPSGFNPGLSAILNSGSGGGGGGAQLGWGAASGGSAGAYGKGMIFSPSASYAFSIGAGGTGGTSGTPNGAGGDGADGGLYLLEHFQ